MKNKLTNEQILEWKQKAKEKLLRFSEERLNLLTTLRTMLTENPKNKQFVEFMDDLIDICKSDYELTEQYLNYDVDGTIAPKLQCDIVDNNNAQLFATEKFIALQLSTNEEYKNIILGRIVGSDTGLDNEKAQVVINKIFGDFYDEKNRS